MKLPELSRQAEERLWFIVGLGAGFVVILLLVVVSFAAEKL